MDAGPTLTLTAEPLDGAAFEAFGRVIDRQPGKPVNEGRGVRIEMGATLDHDTAAAGQSVALYRLDASSWPVPVAMFERHPRSEQLFAPIDGGSYLVIVTPDGPDGGPDAAQARAFLGRPDQHVVYGKGVWHFPMVALVERGSFLMAMWESGGDDDCQSCTIPTPFHVILPPS